MSAVPEVRSFKLRRGRVTSGQAAALQQLAASYGLPPGSAVVDLAAVFGRRAEVVLEIGFGMGEATAELAEREPSRDVVAVDVHTPGVGALLRRLAAGGLTNVRVVEGDAVALLRSRVAPGGLAGVRLFFPDPWPKTRHVKRRLVTPAFCDLVASRLREGGWLHVVTDSAAYAEQVRRVAAASSGLRLSAGPPPDRATTRFERQALSAGRSAIEVVATAARRASRTQT
jgi:tRNA (guanine-N7-)-methyltransferase